MVAHNDLTQDDKMREAGMADLVAGPAGGADEWWPADDDRVREFLRRASERLIRPGLSSSLPSWVRRRWLEAGSTVLSEAAEVRRGRGHLAGIPGRLFIPANPRRGEVIVYFHGGGYVAGSSYTHRTVASRLARAAETKVYVPDYRHAPEHPFPAALDDVQAFYRGLLKVGYAPERITFAGDSAGGGLAVATALRLREGGEPMPGALALISPWLDLALTGESLWTNAEIDPVRTEDWVRFCARSYVGEHSAERPDISPLYADEAALAGLPPVIIQAGSDDIAASDAERFAERAAAAGVLAEFQRYPGLWHDFQLYASLLPDADDALEELAALILTHRRAAA